MEKRLEELLVGAAGHAPGALRELKARVGQAILHHRSFTGDASHSLAAREAEFEKWQLIHKYIHATPYRDRGTLARSGQRRDALERIRDLRDNELTDWVCLQAEVATNLEKGVQAYIYG